MRLWGMLLEVTDRRLVVSLPHGLRGSIDPEEVRGWLAGWGGWVECVGCGGRVVPSSPPLAVASLASLQGWGAHGSATI